MTDNNTLALGIVLDRSGSMATIWEEVVGSVHTMVEEQCQDGDTTIHTLFFDDRIEELDTVEVKEYDGVSYSIPDSIGPRGMTALYDAIGTEVRKMEAIGEDQDKVAILIATDGYENSSQEEDEKTIAKLIEEKKEEGWEFFFIGANQDAWATGGKLNIDQNFDWEQTKDGTIHTYTAASASLRSYRNS